MTRDDYETLIRQKEEISNKLEQFGIEIEQILDAMGVRNDGECKIRAIEGEIAEVRYLEPGCHSSCCGKSYECAKFPAAWLFGADWRAALKGQREEEARLKAEKEAADAERERLELERHDREQFERLKAKFGTS